MRKYQLTSGKVLEFNLAGIETTLELFIAVLNQCKNAGLDISLSEDTQFIDLIKNNKEALLNVFSSKDVMEKVLNCCDKVLYNKKHFSMELFEEEANREDFFGCLIIIGVENLLPFFPALRSYSEIILSLFLRS